MLPLYVILDDAENIRLKKTLVESLTNIMASSIVAGNAVNDLGFKRSFRLLRTVFDICALLQT